VVAGVAEGAVASGHRARVRVERGDELLVDDSYTLTGSVLERRIHLPDPGIDDARAEFLWTPESPNLLNVTITLDLADAGVDTVHTVAALRHVHVRDGALLLNGRPSRPRLALDQGYWPQTHLTPPSSEALRRDVELAKSLGFNGVRKHQKL